MNIMDWAKDTEKVLTARATTGYQLLMAAKTISVEDCEGSVRSNWTPTLAYERARGILDTVQDLADLLIGPRAAADLMRTAAKAVGYDPVDANKYDIHAGAWQATHPSSRPTYTSSPTYNGSRTGTGSTTTQSGVTSATRQDSLLPHDAWDDNPFGTGAPDADADITTSERFTIVTMYTEYEISAIVAHINQMRLANGASRFLTTKQVEDVIEDEWYRDGGDREDTPDITDHDCLNYYMWDADDDALSLINDTRMYQAHQPVTKTEMDAALAKWAARNNITLEPTPTT